MLTRVKQRAPSLYCRHSFRHSFHRQRRLHGTSWLKFPVSDHWRSWLTHRFIPVLVRAHKTEHKVSITLVQTYTSFPAYSQQTLRMFSLFTFQLFECIKMPKDNQTFITDWTSVRQLEATSAAPSPTFTLYLPRSIEKKLTSSCTKRFLVPQWHI